MATSIVGGAIAVDGLKETIRSLQKVRPELAKAARVANKRLTEEIILPEARRNWSSQNVKPSLAQRAVVAAAGANWAGVRSRAKAFPVGAGVTFGAYQFPQFRPWVGNQFTGTGGDYIVSPAVEAKGDEFARRFLENLTDGLVSTLQMEG